MQLINFSHGYDFDPRYGYQLDTLLNISEPEEPEDFVTFWQDLFDRSQAVVTAPSLTEIRSSSEKHRVFDVEYNSLNHLRIKGWLILPKDDPIERGVVIGHGYGGRDGPDMHLPISKAAMIFPCARGLSRSAYPGIPNTSEKHVLYGIQNRHAYILGGCVADFWCAASALIELFPTTANRLNYLGISFGGGIGALALPWDDRFQRAHLAVPSFGHYPLRLTFRCVGSGEAVRKYHQKRGNALDTLCYFDAATAAKHIRIPMHIAAALFDPAVPPPGQFAIYNAIRSPKQLFLLQAGHFDYPDKALEEKNLLRELQEFFKEN